MEICYRKKSRNSSPALKTCWWAFIGVIILLFLATAFQSCTTTRYITVEKIKNDTTYITKHQKDSVWLHDSVEVKVKGDSVWVDRWHTKYVEKQVHDTTYVAKHDTIPQPYPVEKLVEKQLSWGQKLLIYLGWIMLAIIVALIIYGLFKLEKKFR